jgi:ATP-dependent DNA helicase RecG
MASAFDKLRKVLSLERDLGCRDKAVIGGLDQFILSWHREAREEASDPESLRLLEEVVTSLGAYSTLEGQQERERIINEILEKLRQRREEREKVRTQAAVSQAPRPMPGRERQRTPDTGLEAPITSLPDIGKVHARRLQRLRISTIGDLLYLFPRRYDDYSALKTIDKLQYGDEVTIMGTIWDTRVRETRKGMTIITSTIADGTGTIEATWFNQQFLVQRLRPGRQIVLSGKIDQYLGRLVLNQPEWEPLEKELIHTGRLVPVYPLTKGISARWLRRLTKRAVDYWAKKLTDHLPASVRHRAGLMNLETAIRQIHFPDNRESLEKAHRRFAFDEFFTIQLGVLRQRRDWQKVPGRAITISEELLQTFVRSLPFELTAAQRRALDEIVSDLRQPQPMSRLLQGDVGSGKTVVATAAMLMAVVNGFQAVLMAPTEILAEQHYQTIAALLQDTYGARVGEEGLEYVIQDNHVRLRLLTGSTPKADKDTIYEEMRLGAADIVVGTHALIQKGVTFANLGLAIVDEQHRFGVAQRGALRQKGYNPHVLVMSATPIPRSLALTIYGDLDVSVIDELPPGRQEIQTRWLMPRERERAYSFVRHQIEKGRQAFIIYPLVEESDKIEAKAAVDEHHRLQKEIFPDLRLGLLHGRLKGEEKEAVMSAFGRGELDILVSTSVVEVGIDVPNATVMLVDGADRFGLAQLHQFRGRVGRGEHQSYCLLLAESPSEKGQERLQIIESTHDGFTLAEKDLEMRGPGEFFGLRQSGLPDLKMARLSDMKTLEQARTEALALFEQDPQLSSEEHRLLAKKVADFWGGQADLS